MNVAELIAKLSDFDPSLRVVVNGYETGFDVIKTLQIITVQPWQPQEPGAFDAWKTDKPMEYNGELEQCESGEPVVFLPRSSN